MTLVSREGVITTHYDDVADANKPTRGAIVRYSDRTLWGLDFERKATMATNLAGRFETRKNDLLRALRAMGGGANVRPQAAVRLARSSATDTIGTHRLRAYVLNDGLSRWRLWYADLAASPPDVQRDFASVLPVDSESGPVMAEVAGRTLLRVERYGQGTWKIALNTTSIRPISVTSSQFAPPADCHAAAPLAEPRRAVGPYQLNANALRGPGPVMANIEQYLVFWGPAINSAPGPGFRADFLEALTRADADQYLQYLCP